MTEPGAAGSSTSPAAEALLAHQLSSIPPETPEKAPVDDAPNNAHFYLLGDVNLMYLFMPLSLFAKNRLGHHHMRFIKDHEITPLVLNVMLAIQHACVALGQIAAPPTFIFFAWREMLFGEYNFQAAAIIAGISSLLQCAQIKIPQTPYQIGTGMTAFLGNSMMMGLLFNRLAQEIENAEPESAKEAYGKVLGTAAVCVLFLIALSLIPRKYVKPAFPPVVSGIIILLIGLEAVKTSIAYWGGGSFCLRSGLPCIMNGDVRLPFGSSEYIGLGFFVLVMFLLFELFGSAYMRRGIILFSVIIVYIVAAIVKKDGKKYVTGDIAEGSDEIDFLWTTTYKLGFYKHAMIPLLIAFLGTYIQATAVLTASLEESGLSIENDEGDDRIQGGLIVTGITSLFAILATGIPVMPIPQSNSVIYTTRIASRFAGLAGAICLILFGIFPKVLAAFFLEIPICIRGGIFTLLSAGVVLTAVKILSRIEWNRRMSVILFVSVMFGMANLLVPAFFGDTMWTYDTTKVEMSIRTAVLVILQTPFYVGGVVAMILHFILPQDMELGFLDALPSINE